jgi:DNA polymerase III epsilon subunit-like protein
MGSRGLVSSRSLSHMTFVMVDVEADGPVPADYSMVAIGAVVVDRELDKTFYATLRPVSEQWKPDALSVSGFTRAQTLGFENPASVMRNFESWLTENVQGRPVFIADNNGFDWQFVNWYFHHFLGANPFGHSSMNLGSLYRGLKRDLDSSFKHLRKTRHSHNPVDDAKGNAEALLRVATEFNLNVFAGSEGEKA